MTEEIKDPTIEKEAVPYIGKPPMEYFKRLETLDTRSFIGEMKKKARENSAAAISATIVLVLLGENDKGNDPYMLDSKSQKPKTYEIKSGGKRGGA